MKYVVRGLLDVLDILAFKRATMIVAYLQSLCIKLNIKSTDNRYFPKILLQGRLGASTAGERRTRNLLTLGKLSGQETSLVLPDGGGSPARIPPCGCMGTV